MNKTVSSKKVEIGDTDSTFFFFFLFSMSFNIWLPEKWSHHQHFPPDEDITKKWHLLLLVNFPSSHCSGRRYCVASASGQYSSFHLRSTSLASCLLVWTHFLYLPLSPLQLLIFYRSCQSALKFTQVSPNLGKGKTRAHTHTHTHKFAFPSSTLPMSPRKILLISEESSGRVFTLNSLIRITFVWEKSIPQVKENFFCVVITCTCDLP